DGIHRPRRAPPGRAGPLPPRALGGVHLHPGRHRGRHGRPRKERPGAARRRAGGRALRGELRVRHVEAPPGARRPGGAAPAALRRPSTCSRHEPAGRELRLTFEGGKADRLAGGMLPLPMADRSEPHLDDAFAAETSRITARRAGLGLGFVLGLAAVAGLLELAYYPDRLGKLVAAFTTEVMVCAAALLAIRGGRLGRFVVPITS